jgi:peptidoglycan L-alanyl-D-glutamate endopeptidase CwlK
VIASRALEDLLPTVRALAIEFIERAMEQGIDVIVTSTYRDEEAQQALYQQGRALPGEIVTDALPGESYHNYRMAFDFAPIVNGKIPWTDSAIFTRLGMLGEQLGLTWAGRWRGKMRELAHLQWTDGLSIAELKAGMRPADSDMPAPPQVA